MNAQTSTPRAFSPLVALATGLELSLYARLDDATAVAVAAAILGIGAVIVVLVPTLRTGASVMSAMAFWSVIMSAFVAFSFGSVFAIASLLG